MGFSLPILQAKKMFKNFLTRNELSSFLKNKGESMKKFLVALAFLVASFQMLHSNQFDLPEFGSIEPSTSDSFSYRTIGMGPLPMPMLNIGIGKRLIFKVRSAIDLNVSGSTLVLVNTLQGSISRLWYSSSQYYLGLGGTLGAGFLSSLFPFCYAAPALTFGKEFFNSSGCKRFFQIEAMFPVFILNIKETKLIPGVTVKYGIAF